MKTQIKSMKRNETGSIMLEVVAVLALMGVMGAMLFRQIYQRNQELHNIQMASEIRTVKEAFSAYIQANRASVLEQCPVPSCDATGCEVLRCSVSDLNAGVAGYLPDGWFTAEELDNAYKQTVWKYLQDDVSDRRVVYGIVVPKEATLPTTGWNFKRAARVALLVGADGGAYDTTITDGKIAGALGSWEIDATDTGIQDHSYAAMTGIDIFAPEYEAPEGAVGLPAEWDLALKNLHAYNYFAVGRKDGAEANCYTIQKDGEKRKYNLTENMVYSDSVTTNINNCQPLFWVGSDDGANGTSGNVYVQNDLNVGADMTGNGDHALTLTKEGVIKQKDGLIIDKYGRIFSRDLVYADIGDLKQGEHFVLDLERTSTMKDIRLASRGGARLSDILPNYILKEQQEISSSTLASGKTYTTITKPTCPTGYNQSLSIVPTSWDKVDLKVNIPQLDIGAHKTTAKNDVNLDTANNQVDIPQLDIVAHKTTAKNDVDILNEKGLCIIVNSTQKATATGSDTWNITLGYREGTTCTYNSSIRAIAQTYCVWYPGLLNQTQCQAAGYKWDSTATPKCTGIPYAEYNMADQSDALEIDESLCTCLGFEWDSTQVRCRYKFIKPSLVKGLEGKTCAFEERYKKGTHQITKTEMITICKMLGYNWDGTDCKCPGDQIWNNNYGCQNPDPT